MVPPTPRPGVVVAEGGGLDVDKPSGRDLFAWMVERARKLAPHPGAIMVGAVPLEKDERVDAFNALGAAGAGLVIDEASPDKPEFADQLAAASIIFIRGGDQSRYVNWWRGKKTEAAIQSVFARGGIIGGTSAGCACLGEITYDSNAGSLMPLGALADARDPRLTLTPDFLNLAPGVIFDTHFAERGRLPRLALMLAHCRDLLHRPVLGVGVDPRTAVCIDTDGVATVRGEGTATILSLPPQTPVEIEGGKPPTLVGLRYTQLSEGATFDPRTGEVLALPPHAAPNPHPEVVDDTSFESLTIDGARAEDAAFGIRFLLGGERPRKADDRVPPPAPPPGPRDPELATGQGRVPQCIFTTRAWSALDPHWSMTMTQRALAESPGLLACWLDEGAGVTSDDTGTLAVRGAGDTPRAAVFLDSRGVTHAGVAPGPHPRVTLVGATLHVLAPGWTIAINSRAVRRA